VQGQASDVLIQAEEMRRTKERIIRLYAEPPEDVSPLGEYDDWVELYNAGDTIVQLARRTADEVFIPFTIGGGIRSVRDAQAVLDAGADKISVNSAAENDGAWVEVIAGVEVLVRGDHYGPFRQALADAVRAASRRLGPHQVLSIEERERITYPLIVRHLLLDWRGIEGEDGSPIPFSQEEALKIFSNPDYRPFRDVVAGACAEVGVLARVQMETTAKN